VNSEGRRKFERIQDSNSNPRPRLKSEPGAPSTFFELVVEEAKRPASDDKEKLKAGRGSVLKEIWDS
jgi:hypothetical protein